MIEVSLVVINWNGREQLLACLESIGSAGWASDGGPRAGCEVIVVDNGSDDGSAEAVRQRYPWVELVALERNLGFAGGANAGLRRARGRFRVLLNNDVRLRRGALEACVDHLLRHPDVAVVGPALRSPDGRLQNAIHPAPTLLTELVPLGVLEVLAPRRYPSKRRPPPGPVAVESLLGACLVIRAEVLERIGFLPEAYFFFLEETDWCLQLRRAGWKVVHLPQVEVVHVHGATSKKRFPLATRIEYHRSLYLFFRRWRGPGPTTLVVAVRLLRAAAGVPLAAVLGLFSRRQRARLGQRLGVVAWHLRGCPSSSGLRALAAERAVVCGSPRCGAEPVR